MARYAQSLCHSCFRSHAAADAGQPRSGVLSAFHDPLSDHRCTRTRATQGRDGTMGRAGLLRAGAESSPFGKAGSGNGKSDTRRSRGVADSARHRPVHGGRRCVFCIRKAGAGGRYERAACLDARIRAEGCVGARHEVDAARGGAGLEVQSGTDGAGRAGMYRAEAEVPRMSRQERLSNRSVSGANS